MFDSLNAFTTTTLLVEVKASSTLGVDYEAIDSMLQGSLGVGNVDDVKRSLSIVSSSINANYCGSNVSPKFCYQVNRNPCKQTRETCGVCLPGYLGEDGDSNSRCYNSSVASSFVKAEASKRTDFKNQVTGFKLKNSDTEYEKSVTSLQGTSCHKDGDCAGMWQSCIMYECKPTPKSCTAGCSGHGSCYYVTSSGEVSK